MKLKKAFLSMGKTPKEYAIKVVVPTMVIGVLIGIAVRMVLPPSTLVNVASFLIPLMSVVLIIFYPLMSFGKRAHEIDINMHYFITEMGALATSDISRMKLFEILAKNDRYGALADEAKMIYHLMATWHLSLVDACRFVAKRTPSELLADFLDRFAHAVQSGEDLEKFLRAEQSVVMNDYEAMYTASLRVLEVLKETFISLIMSMIFLASFALIMPIIMGGDPLSLMITVMMLFMMVDIIVIFAVRRRMGSDPIWHQLDIETEAEKKLKKTFPITVVGCAVIGSVLFLKTDLPPAIILALSLTPLAYTGNVAKKIEHEIKRRDDSYPAFIRSLGSSAGAMGGLIIEALRSLRTHDFGPLTTDINRLYKRLLTRINKHLAWDYFSAGTGSNLIQRFSTMFVEATDLGGKPEVIGDIISENFHRVVNLRKHRYQSASAFVGVLYGLTGGIAFTLFISISIVDVMKSLYEEIEIPSGLEAGMMLNVSGIDIHLMSLLILFILVVHSLLSSILLKIIDGGHIFCSYSHFVGMVWVSVICAEITRIGVGSLLGLS